MKISVKASDSNRQSEQRPTAFGATHCRRKVDLLRTRAFAAARGHSPNLNVASDEGFRQGLQGPLEIGGYVVYMWPRWSVRVPRYRTQDDKRRTEFGGHNTVFHTGRFRVLPCRRLLRPRPSASQQVATNASSPAGRPARVAFRSLFIGPCSADCRNPYQSVTSHRSVRSVTKESYSAIPM